MQVPIRRQPDSESAHEFMGWLRMIRYMLVTHNTGEFDRVDGLQVEDWELP